jgi:hypothetical protein
MLRRYPLPPTLVAHRAPGPRLVVEHTGEAFSLVGCQPVGFALRSTRVPFHWGSIPLIGEESSGAMRASCRAARPLLRYDR